MKVCFVGSSGGHLHHLYLLKPFWQDKERFWVTFEKEDAISLLKGERMYYCYGPSNRSLKALVINCFGGNSLLAEDEPQLKYILENYDDIIRSMKVGVDSNNASFNKKFSEIVDELLPQKTYHGL